MSIGRAQVREVFLFGILLVFSDVLNVMERFLVPGETIIVIQHRLIESLQLLIKGDYPLKKRTVIFAFSFLFAIHILLGEVPCAVFAIEADFNVNGLQWIYIDITAVITALAYNSRAIELLHQCIVL